MVPMVSLNASSGNFDIGFDFCLIAKSLSKNIP
jgi:hypothetical protein